MKKLFTLIGIISCMTVLGQNEVKFKESDHKFGKITQNVPVSYVFKFTNTSVKPVVIEFVTPDCGCTTPEYPKEAIPKGKTSNIKVTYNAAAIGSFKKNVTVKFANVKLPYIVTIEGEVLEAKAKTK